MFPLTFKVAPLLRLIQEARDLLYSFSLSLSLCRIRHSHVNCKKSFRTDCYITIFYTLYPFVNPMAASIAVTVQQRRAISYRVSVETGGGGFFFFLLLLTPGVGCQVGSNQEDLCTLHLSLITLVSVWHFADREKLN